MAGRTLDHPDYISLVASLRRARLARGLTQADVAAKLGRAQSYVAKVEGCERRADVMEVLRLCRVLDVRLSDVLPGEYEEFL